MFQCAKMTHCHCDNMEQLCKFNLLTKTGWPRPGIEASKQA